MMNPRCRRKSAAALAAAVTIATVAAPPMASGATTSTLDDIRLNTAPLPAAISTLADLDDFSCWRIGWGAGETVTVTAPDSTMATLADQAAEAGSTAFSLRSAGNWTLYNSGEGTVSIAIASSAFDDIPSQPSAPFLMDTVGEGPNRTTKIRQAPPVAYTGDNWMGDAARTSTLTFTPPYGSATTRSLSGTGATAFEFRKAGTWTVRLAMADGTTLVALVAVDGNTVVFVL